MHRSMNAFAQPNGRDARHKQRGGCARGAAGMREACAGRCMGMAHGPARRYPQRDASQCAWRQGQWYGPRAGCAQAAHQGTRKLRRKWPGPCVTGGGMHAYGKRCIRARHRLMHARIKQRVNICAEESIRNGIGNRCAYHGEGAHE